MLEHRQRAVIQEGMKVGESSGAVASNVRSVARMDLPGGGQVTVAGRHAFVGHMEPPLGTSILDIADPRHPRVVSQIRLEGGHSHSHKCRVVQDHILIVNSEQERQGPLARAMRIPVAEADLTRDLGRPASDAEIAAALRVEAADMPAYRRYLQEGGYRHGGFTIYDISNPAEPRRLAFQKTWGKGVHRFDCDDTYAYISTEMEGFLGNILVIYDIRDPARPEEVSRWWMPGQHIAGGEILAWRGTSHRLHHTLRSGDTLWASCWGAGAWAIDISDVRRPRTLGHVVYNPPFREMTHTFMRVPFPLGGREIAIAIDEESRHHIRGQDHAFLWVMDVADPAAMKPVSTYRVSEADSPHAKEAMAVGERFGAHQFREAMTDSLVYAVWFSGGLRIVDLADPTTPVEAGFFIPEPGRGKTRVPGVRTVQSNDVDLDDRGLIYIIDRLDGFDVAQYVPHG